MLETKEAKGERTCRYPVPRIQGWAQEEFLSHGTSLPYPVSGNGPFLFNLYDRRFIQMSFKPSGSEKGNIRKGPTGGKI